MPYTTSDALGNRERQDAEIVLPKNRNPLDARLSDVVLSQGEYDASSRSREPKLVVLRDGRHATIAPGNGMPKGVRAPDGMDEDLLPMLVEDVRSQLAKFDLKEQEKRRMRIQEVADRIVPEILNQLTQRITFDDPEVFFEKLAATFSRSDLRRLGLGVLTFDERDNMVTHQGDIAFKSREEGFQNKLLHTSLRIDYTFFCELHFEGKTFDGLPETFDHNNYVSIVCFEDMDGSIRFEMKENNHDSTIRQNVDLKRGLFGDSETIGIFDLTNGPVTCESRVHLVP